MDISYICIYICIYSVLSLCLKSFDLHTYTYVNKCVCVCVFFLQHVNDAGESWTWLLFLICLTTTLGSTVPVGYFFGVLNAPAEIIQSWCDEVLSNEYDTNSSESQLNLLWTSIVSIYLIGGICGSCFSACCCNKYGRFVALISVK